MMNRMTALKALSDGTRMDLLIMLLENNCCVRALARRLRVTEATVSQHLKVLSEAGLVSKEKRGRFTHYNVERGTLKKLAYEIESLAAIKRMACISGKAGCQSSEQKVCNSTNPACGCGRASI